MLYVDSEELAWVVLYFGVANLGWHPGKRMENYISAAEITVGEQASSVEDANKLLATSSSVDTTQSTNVQQIYSKPYLELLFII